MKKEISIIIPCYNSEKYIEKCLDSVICQIADFDYEIIIIDDASSDGTASVVERYVEGHKDANIVFIKNEKNLGAGASRNRAVAAAKYGYVSFIDSDDYISDDYYKELYNAAAVNGADVTACDIVMVNDGALDQTVCKACYSTPSKFSLISTSLSASPCNKLIKREYLIKYPFAEGIMNEDVATVLPIIANCGRVAYSKRARYYYVQRGDSTQNSPLTDKKLDIVKAVEIYKERTKDNPDYEKFLSSVIYNQFICLLLYIPMKEKRFFKRAGFIRKFNRLTKCYELRRNVHFWKLLEESSIKTKIFYKTYMKLLCSGFAVSASACVSAVNLIKNDKPGKSVIKKDITKHDVIRAAAANAKKKGSKTVTASIPNYNYEEFLYQRLYSILYQDYRIAELLILDDCSKDNSRELIDNIVPELSKYVNVRKIYNEKNSGSPFKQWRKSLEEATSDYIWIAEADDYCDRRMLPSIMKLVEGDPAISIAYADTAFINKSGGVILKTIKPEIDIMKTGHWDSDFVNDGVDEIKHYAFLNCTVANVSSAIFRRDDYSEVFDELGNYRQVGDYLFYLTAMQRGKVAFINKPYNYYRVHGTNVTSTTKKQLHFDELRRVHSLLDEKFGFDAEQRKHLNTRYEFLRRVWDLGSPNGGAASFLAETLRTVTVSAARRDGVLTVAEANIIESGDRGMFILADRYSDLYQALSSEGGAVLSGSLNFGGFDYSFATLECRPELCGKDEVDRLFDEHEYLADYFPSNDVKSDLAAFVIRGGKAVKRERKGFSVETEESDYKAAK